MVTYINSLDRGNTPFLNELEKKAREDRVPVIRRGDAEFPESIAADKTSPPHFRGGDCCWVLHASDERIRAGDVQDHHHREL